MRIMPWFSQWLPMLKDGSLQTGEFSLPVMLDPPPPNYLYINPEVMLPGTRWVDNHKGIFNIVIEAVTSVHTLVLFLGYSCCLAERLNLLSAKGSLSGSFPQHLLRFGGEPHRPTHW